MDDLGHKWTEEELAALERRIYEVYSDAEKDLRQKADVYFAKLEDRDKKQRALLEEGKIAEEQYLQWRLAQIGRGKRFEALRDEMAERMTEANKTAVAYINDTTPGIYSLNHNYAAYTIEQVAGNVGFTIYDEQTIRRLIQEDPDLLPKRRVNAPKDLKWNRKRFTAEITSGILQGESVKMLADRVEHLSDANRSGAIRNARTAVTGAQNAGRQASYDRAKGMGLKLRKRWIATKDDRTRHSHAMLDGQTVALNETFKVDGYELMYPGDPTGKPYLIWNCRCTMRTVEKEGIEAEPRQMRVRDPVTGRSVLVNEMTYQEWEAWKRAENAIEDAHKKYGAGLTMNANDGILSEKDVYALNQYKSSAVAYPLNSILRGEAPMTEEYREIAHNIDQALLKLPAYEGVVHRSLRSEEIVDIESFWRKYTPGAMVLEQAYTSASEEVYDETMDIQMIIQSKRGRDMREINPLEKEILFRRGSVFWVEKREGSTIWLTEI